MNELDTVLYVDCAKLGVLSQVSINALGELAERLLFRNPSRYSLLITVAVFNLCCPVRILVFGSKKNPSLPPSNFQGSVLVLIPPLLVGTDAAGSLRRDVRT